MKDFSVLCRCGLCTKCFIPFLLYFQYLKRLVGWYLFHKVLSSFNWFQLRQSYGREQSIDNHLSVFLSRFSTISLEYYEFCHPQAKWISLEKPTREFMHHFECNIYCLAFKTLCESWNVFTSQITEATYALINASSQF